jgi:putative ABC transport system substrate-binding protein
MTRVLARLTLAGLLALVAAPLPAGAQSAGKVYRIGCVWPATRDTAQAYVKLLHASLHELGSVEGTSVVIQHRYGDQPERIPEYLEKFARANVDAILAITNPVTAAAKRATTTIPIVTLYTFNPVGASLVHSLARPGGNITGVAFDAAPDTYSKHLELLKMALPGVVVVGVVRSTAFYRAPGMEPYAEAVAAAARRLGLTLRFFDVATIGEIEAAFRRSPGSGLQAMYVMPDPMTFSNAARIATWAAQARLPSVYAYRDHVEVGGLLSYGANIREMPRQAAVYFDRIFKGARPAELPIEQPTKFELVINLKTAKALGVSLPRPLLLRADEIFE